MTSLIEAAAPYVGWLALLLAMANYLTGWRKERRERHVSIVRAIGEAENEFRQIATMGFLVKELAPRVFPEKAEELRDRLDRLAERLEAEEIRLPTRPGFWTATHARHVLVQRRLLEFRGRKSDVEILLAVLKEDKPRVGE